jgi:cell division protein FtsQ
VVLVVGSLLYGAHDLRVGRISVYGVAVADRGALEAGLAPVLGSRLVWLDGGALAQRLGEDPWIRSVRLRRQLPDELVVRVHERRPLLCFDTGEGGLAAVDDTGRILPPRDGLDLTPLPLVLDLHVDQEGSLPPSQQGRLEELVKALAVTNWPWPGGLSRIVLEGEAGVELISSDGLRLVLGGGDFEERLRIFATVRAQLDPRPGDRVDLRFDRQVVLAPASPAASSSGG